MHAFLAAGTLVVAGVSTSTSAAASEWACKAIMCLSNPSGPTQYSECIPSIEKLSSSMSFPGCPSAGPYDLKNFSGGRVMLDQKTGQVRPSWASRVDIGRRFVRYTSEVQGTKLVWLDERLPTVQPN